MASVSPLLLIQILGVSAFAIYVARYMGWWTAVLAVLLPSSPFILRHFVSSTVTLVYAVIVFSVVWFLFFSKSEYAERFWDRIMGWKRPRLPRVGSGTRGRARKRKRR